MHDTLLMSSVLSAYCICGTPAFASLFAAADDGTQCVQTRCCAWRTHALERLTSCMASKSGRLAGSRSMHASASSKYVWCAGSASERSNVSRLPMMPTACMICRVQQAPAWSGHDARQHLACPPAPLCNMHGCMQHAAVQGKCSGECVPGGRRGRPRRGPRGTSPTAARRMPTSPPPAQGTWHLVLDQCVCWTAHSPRCVARKPIHVHCPHRVRYTCRKRVRMHAMQEW